MPGPPSATSTWPRATWPSASTATTTPCGWPGPAARARQPERLNTRSVGNGPTAPVCADPNPQYVQPKGSTAHEAQMVLTERLTGVLPIGLRRGAEQEKAPQLRGF